jgi:hypothetical protein
MDKENIVVIPITFPLTLLRSHLVDAKRLGEQTTEAFHYGNGKPVEIDKAIAYIDEAITDGYVAINSRGLHRS